MRKTWLYRSGRWNTTEPGYKDQRHIHDGPEVPAHAGRKKNTKRWCKGKVGREHEWKFLEPGEYPPNMDWLNWGARNGRQCHRYAIWQCEKCKKVVWKDPT